MIAGATRNEPYPYEEFLIEDMLESAAGQETLLATIEKLVEEQYELRIQLAQHTMKDRVAKERLRAINSQALRLWTEVRRMRAVRRVELEEALGIDAAVISN